jgi:DNA-binding NarL/FixJ family response regulator
MARHLRLAGTPCPMPSGGTVTIVLADDHPGVRRTLRQLLDGEEGLRVVAEASDPEHVLQALRAHCPRVLVVDLWTSDGRASAKIEDLRASAPGTRIVVVSTNDTPALARVLLDAGAASFVLKELADTDLPRAIRTAAGGGTFVSPRVAERLRTNR